MNAPTRVDALVRELYRLKEALAEARYPPDPGDERRLDGAEAQRARQSLTDPGREN